MENFPSSSSNWVERNARKIVAAGAIAIASLGSVEAQSTQHTYVAEKDTAVMPTKTWHFDGERKIEATNKSIRYPGFVENYIRNIDDGRPDTNSYSFAGYTTEDGNSIETPEAIHLKVIRAEAELALLNDPEAWAKKQFAYQSTDAYKKELWNKLIAQQHEQIDKEKKTLDVLENSNDTTAVSNGGETETHSQTIARHQKELELWQNSLAAFQADSVHALAVKLKEETYSYEDLLSQAKADQSRAQEEYEGLLAKEAAVKKYIAAHM